MSTAMNTDVNWAILNNRRIMTSTTSEMHSPRLIAFHLPQFHRIPENDAWWGNGFTEWTNVRKSKPLYKGHRQPAVPLDNNYYNLTEPAIRGWQARLARAHGIYGFCYYHYWFKGRKLLEKPCEAILESGTPDFPFCFSWANESWTRAWDGANHEVLIQQDYGSEPDWKAHFDYLLPFFRDRRYITHNGKPMFLIYRANDFAGMPKMIACWDRWAQEAKLPGIFFVKTLTAFDGRHGTEGFSASACMEPWLTVRGRAAPALRCQWHAQKLVCRLLSAWGRPQKLRYVYEDIWKQMVKRTYAANEFRGAFVGWDNTPRRGPDSWIFMGGTPEKFRAYMEQQLAGAAQDGAPYVFVNAWNEWAEGAYLEPDVTHEYAYLQGLKAAVDSISQASREQLSKRLSFPARDTA